MHTLSQAYKKKTSGLSIRALFYLCFFLAAFFRSIARLISSLFFVLRECLDFSFGLRVVPLFAMIFLLFCYPASNNIHNIA